MKVARDTPVAVGDKVYEPGGMFIVSEVAVENAIARGLVEQVQPKGEGGG